MTGQQTSADVIDFAEQRRLHALHRRVIAASLAFRNAGSRLAVGAMTIAEHESARAELLAEMERVKADLGPLLAQNQKEKIA